MPTPLMNPFYYHGEGNSVLIENPSLITKDECLALARCGALEWNKWRENFPAIEVENLDSIERNFSNIADFSDLDHLSADTTDEFAPRLFNINRLMRTAFPESRY